MFLHSSIFCIMHWFQFYSCSQGHLPSYILVSTIIIVPHYPSSVSILFITSNDSILMYTHAVDNINSEFCLGWGGFSLHPLLPHPSPQTELIIPSSVFCSLYKSLFPSVSLLMQALLVGQSIPVFLGRHGAQLCSWHLCHTCSVNMGT